MTSPNFTTAHKLLEETRVNTLKWIIERCGDSFDYNDVVLVVKPRRDPAP
jgi:hypothetical protein